VPEFGHTPLILNQQGAKLSKRDGVTSISDFQAMGYTPEALVNYMTLLGWSPVEGMGELFSLAEAAQVFSFDRVNKAGAKFDWDKLNWINSQYLHHMPVDQLTDLLMPYWQQAGYAFDPVGDRAWLEQLTPVIGPSLTTLPEAVEMVRYLFMPEFSLSDEARAHLQQASVKAILEGILASLPTEELTETTAQALIAEAVKQQGVKKGLVMKSLRAGLTGMLQGPDLIQSWLLLHQRGWDRTRLQTAIAAIESK
jgi:glutamyl-tRNA synthetase